MRQAAFAFILGSAALGAFGCATYGAALSPAQAVLAGTEKATSAAEARHFLSTHLSPDYGMNLWVNDQEKEVLSASANLTSLTVTTTGGPVKYSLADFPMEDCQGRDKGGIYVTGLFGCGSGHRRFSINWRSPDNGIAQGFIDAFGALKKDAESLLSAADDSRFEEATSQYRATAVKPRIDEDVVRLKIQAEDSVMEKDFVEAAMLFKKALDLAPWWPEGRFNLALVLGETGDYGLAIREMKRYLTLVPDAANTRTAQNKIYAWERKTR